MPTQLQNLSDETRDELAALALKLSGNKKTRKGFLGLVKEAAPETPIPEIDAEITLEERFKAERKAREDFEAKQNERWFQEDLGRQKNSAKSRFGLSDEDITKMEEMMKKGELPADYKFAPQLYRAQLDAATPTTFGGGPYEGPLRLEANAKEFEGLMEDESKWSVDTAHQMIDEMQKKGSARTF